MRTTELPLIGALLILYTSYEDKRGSFSKLFNLKSLEELQLDFAVQQINHSINLKSATLRGMHFQLPPYQEAKIVICIKGKVFDVIVDIRKDSPTYLKWHSEVLSSQKNTALYIPAGFAHGFQTLEDDTELLYFHNNIYKQEAESGILHNDPMLAISWPLTPRFVSEKDLSFPLLANKDA